MPGTEGSEAPGGWGREARGAGGGALLVNRAQAHPGRRGAFERRPPWGPPEGRGDWVAQGFYTQGWVQGRGSDLSPV